MHEFLFPVEKNLSRLFPILAFVATKPFTWTTTKDLVFICSHSSIRGNKKSTAGMLSDAMASV